MIGAPPEPIVPCWLGFIESSPFDDPRLSPPPPPSVNKVDILEGGPWKLNEDEVRSYRLKVSEFGYVRDCCLIL